MPLTNASHETDAEYLSDGITEAIINCLAGLPNLRIIPRSTVFRYKGQHSTRLRWAASSMFGRY